MSEPVSFAKGHYTGGQPSPDDLARLVAEGVRTVINLRAPNEPVDFDEAREAERLGLRYVGIPIAGAGDLDRDRVARFGQALDVARQQGGVLIHCASSNRVGAMVALDEVLNRGRPLAQALEAGRAAGLVALEPAVVAVAGREGAAQ